ncbi:MAG: energy-coupling factor transporter transmembrane component T [Anaerolineales bacterium]|jgi:energy-coupling factor transport system permease protein
MSDKLSYYIDRASPVHSLNPLTKLTAAFTLIVLAFFGPGYWLPSLLFAIVLIPLSFWAQVGIEFLRTVIRFLLPVFAFLFIMQMFFYPGGETPIFRIWFLTATVEGVRFAYQLVTRILVLISAAILFLLTTPPTTMMSDLAQRGLPGALPFVITSTLQIIPQMRQKANTIIDAQRSRGLETEGSLRQRVGALLPLVGPLVFGSIVDVEERTIAIEARAFTSPNKKTSLFEIPDPRYESIARWVMVAIMIVTVGSRIWRL